MTEKTVLCTRNDTVVTITLNRPSALNALNESLTSELISALKEIQADETIRAVVLTGAGRGFCSGGDLDSLIALKKPAEQRTFVARTNMLVSLLMNMEKPTIAMVNGVAAGAGCNLALACDIVFAAQSARFGQSFVKVGLVPDCGGMYLLPRTVGLHKAKELMFTGDLINADTALSLGLVNHIVADDKLKETVENYAVKLTKMAPFALALMKRVLNRSDTMDMETVLETEADVQALCMQTNDHKEGVAAFKAKRPPVFTGK